MSISPSILSQSENLGRYWLGRIQNRDFVAELEQAQACLVDGFDLLEGE